MDTIEKIPTLGKTQETLLYEVQGTKYEVPAAAGRLCTKYYVDLEARNENQETRLFRGETRFVCSTNSSILTLKQRTFSIKKFK